MEHTNETGERRSIHRRRMLKSIKLIPDQKLSLFDGVARDYCKNGARITILDAHRLPNRLDFRFADQTEPVPAQIIWRQENQIGIEFLSTR